jgi:FHA domain/Double zinc ribbon
VTSTCPNGHTSESADYCDTCGAPIPSASAAPAPPAASGTPAAPEAASAVAAEAAPAVAAKECPNCGDDATPDALFCESCGYDFTTGTMPRATASPGAAATPEPAPVPPPVQVEWVVERWVDPDWYAAQDADDPLPSPGLPVVVPLTAKSVLVGRPSRSRGITPDIDCGDDTGVSRRQAQLTTDGRRWWVEDLQSSNGTYVGPASGPLPTTPLPPGQRQELAEDDRVYVGAWTRLVVRRATEAEAAGQA